MNDETISIAKAVVRDQEMSNLMEDAMNWRKLCEAADECKVSFILEGASGSIDGGVIVTDIEDVLDHINGFVLEDLKDEDCC